LDPNFDYIVVKAAKFQYPGDDRFTPGGGLFGNTGIEDRFLLNGLSPVFGLCLLDI
jgi:hypothetical protein